MSNISKRVNEFFKIATKSEIKRIQGEICITEHLNKVYEMFYIQKQSIDYIAYSTGYSRGKIEADLRLLREKMKYLV